MPKDKSKCCVEPADLRVISCTPVGSQPLVAHTVPAGKVFVLTSWTMGCPFQASGESRVRRSGVAVGEQRIVQTQFPYGHVNYQQGIAFAAGETIEIENFGGVAYHYLYGYEVDD